MTVRVVMAVLIALNAWAMWLSIKKARAAQHPMPIRQALWEFAGVFLLGGAFLLPDSLVALQFVMWGLVLVLGVARVIRANARPDRADGRRR